MRKILIIGGVILTYFVLIFTMYSAFIWYYAFKDVVYILGDRQDIIFRIDKSFSEKEVDTIRLALKEWEVATNGFVKLDSYVEDIKSKELFTWSNDLMPTIYNASSFICWQTHVALCFADYYSHYGVAKIGSGDIFILDKSKLKATVVHEVGHILMGSYHSPNSNDIMYYALHKGNTKITKFDSEMARKLIPHWNCLVR